MHWYSSDFHFGHAKILEYDNRPFATIEEMNEEIVNRFNEVVKPDDELFYLGDFALGLNGQIDKIYEYRSRFNCKHWRYVLGNHDDLIKKNEERLLADRVFDSIEYYMEIKENKKKMVLSHCPFLTWNGANHGSWCVHGHCHHNLQPDPYSLRVDVGVNGWNYYPVSFEQIADYMRNKQYRPVDHHSVGVW